MAILRNALLGVTGWLLRLLFAASVIAGVVGVVIALFVSAFPADPVPDRLTGLAIVGVAIGVSLVSFALLCTPAFNRFTGRHWYLWTYLTCTVMLVPALLFSVAGRLIEDQFYSSESVQATADSCSEDYNDSWISCDFSWIDQAGAIQRQTLHWPRDVTGSREDIYIDSRTGGAVDHGIGMILVSLTSALIILPAVLTLSYRYAEEERNARDLHRWLANLAWWRAPPEP